MSKPEAYSLQFDGPLLELPIIQNGVRQRLDTPSGAVAAGRAYHVAGTYNGSKMKLFVNGALVASRSLSGPASVTTRPLALASWDGSSEFFRGVLDDVAIYRTALAATCIAAHYTAATT